jgi:hypothetical protein
MIIVDNYSRRNYINRGVKFISLNPYIGSIIIYLIPFRLAYIRIKDIGVFKSLLVRLLTTITALVKKVASYSYSRRYSRRGAYITLI